MRVDGTSHTALLRIASMLCVAGLVIPYLLTWRLWTTERLHPLTPAHKWLLQVDGVWSVALFVLAIASLLAALHRRLAAPALTLYLGIAIFWLLQDIGRNIIMFYMYNCMVLVLCFWEWHQKRHPGQGDPGYLNNIRAIVCGTYIWGGLNKINLYFYTEVLPWFISPIIPNIHDYALGALFVLAVPFFETTIGLGLLLLCGKWRNISVLLAFCMLCCNLYCLGPLGHGWAIGVWGWNVVMFLFVFFLFYRQPEESLHWRKVLLPRTWLTWPIILCIFIGPGTWHLGLWPTSNSFLMYDGMRPTVYYAVDEELQDKLPDLLQQVISEHGSEFTLIHWGAKENNFNGSAVRASYDNAAQVICDHTGETGGVTMKIIHKPRHPFAPKTMETLYPCLPGAPKRGTMKELPLPF